MLVRNGTRSARVEKQILFNYAERRMQHLFLSAPRGFCCQILCNAHAHAGGGVILFCTEKGAHLHPLHLRSRTCVPSPSRWYENRVLPRGHHHWSAVPPCIAKSIRLVPLKAIQGNQDTALLPRNKGLHARRTTNELDPTGR